MPCVPHPPCWRILWEACTSPVPCRVVHAASCCCPRLELQRRLVCWGTVGAVCPGAQLFSDGSENTLPFCLSQPPHALPAPPLALTHTHADRAHVDSASELVKLYADKFDLLQSGGSSPKKPAGSGPSAATVKALEELKTVIKGHLQVRRRELAGWLPCV